MPVTHHSHGKFDGDLRFGHAAEQQIVDLFEGRKKIEVKADRLWDATGNIAFEVEYQRRPSGVFATEADWFIQVLTLNGAMYGALVFESESLRVNLTHMMQTGRARVVYGGDNGSSKLALVKLTHLCDLF